MVLIDTSAWVEFLRGTGSPTNTAARAVLDQGGASTCGPVRLELLAGVRPTGERRLLAALARSPLLPTGAADFDLAARLFRRCRDRGETVRSQIDCLIAAIAISNDVDLLHNDRDFDVLARHTPLRATRG